MNLNKEIPYESLTQKDIMQFLLHSTQHVATREELQDVKNELKNDISKVEDKISKVEATLRQDISKVDAKFDKIQWLIIATITTILLKDYIFSFLQTAQVVQQ